MTIARNPVSFGDLRGWIDALKDAAEKHVTDEMMRNPKPEWGDDIPDTKEAYVTNSL